MLGSIIVLGAGTAGLISALMIKAKYPYTNVKVIRSKDIGIIGVGEGSTEHWDDFLRFTNINHLEVICETDATIKIGILFKEWNNNSEYVHSVGYHSMSGINRPEFFNQLLLNNINSKFPLSPEFELIYYKNKVALTQNLKPSNQYHFDTFKLNEFLQKKCLQRGIEIVDGTVVDVNITPEGNISGLKLENQKELVADFFIDCSGFKRIISSKVGCSWVSFKEFLPLNHAIALPTELDTYDDIEPYTTATALYNGWCWKIPTQTRYGNGYVFCDEYVDTDEALGEFSRHLKKDIEKVARDIKFEAGRIDSFWKKNVVSIGLSSSFAEPLEAQSIGFTIVQMFNLLNKIDLWTFNTEVSEDYNKKMNESFDNIISYLQLHYFGNRDDSKFWRDRPFKTTPFNKQVLALAKQGVIDAGMFEHTHNMFKVPNWFQVLAGLQLINRENLISSLNKNEDSYNKTFQNSVFNHVVDLKTNFKVIKHRDFLNLVKYNAEHSYENRNTFFTLG